MSAEPAGQRFARLVLAAFQAAGRPVDSEVGAAGGPSTTFMTQLRKARDGAEMSKPRNDTLKRIDAAASWPAGTAAKVWDGMTPPDPTRADYIWTSPPGAIEMYPAPQDPNAARWITMLRHEVDHLRERIEILEKSSRDARRTYPSIVSEAARRDTD